MLFTIPSVSRTEACAFRGESLSAGFVKILISGNNLTPGGRGQRRRSVAVMNCLISNGLLGDHYFQPTLLKFVVTLGQGTPEAHVEPTYLMRVRLQTKLIPPLTLWPLQVPTGYTTGG